MTTAHGVPPRLLSRPREDFWAQLRWTIVVAVEGHQNRVAVRVEHGQANGVAKGFLLNELRPLSPDGLRDVHVESLCLVSQSPEQNGERLDLPMSLHDRPNLQARSSKSFVWLSATSAKSGDGSKALERRSSPAPIR
jgi:hypothetical protein